MPDEHHYAYSSRPSGTLQPRVSQHTSSHATPMGSGRARGAPSATAPPLTAGGFPVLPDSDPPPSRPLRVVVADDNPVVRAGLTALLRDRADLDVVAEAADGRQAYEAVVRHRPDVVLLDVRMPGVDGISALPYLVRLAPVLMMTYSSEGEIVHEALRRGAGGYLVHGEFTADQLITAVRDITAGRAAFSHSASGALLAGVRGTVGQTSPPGRDGGRPAEESGGVEESSVLPGGLGSALDFPRRSSHTQSDVGHSSPVPGAAGGLDGVLTELSRREGEVMELIASGLTNQQIAASCFISQKTVKNHINRIFTKLNAGSRGEAIAIWHRFARRGSGPA
ncbi:response regulator [Streptomyces sp. NPDC051018]|uniref:response regulator n=1 Tax=Streptomyces sp. NPDC051018 TaxID=3365639 RepID=UPI0037915461